ncbi:MAG: shikimate dehydrogenase [Verrucomicrobia bacterium]|nr:MAG: shikimate dehydrogenase [Verrucomicrobiota bacterium]
MKEVYTLADLKSWEAKGKSPVHLGVFGDPVAQSLSPQMQNAALESEGLKESYGRFQISAEELEDSLDLVRHLNFVGINLTLPHKADALDLMDEVDTAARQCGAINTVLVEGENLVGFNTDGLGFLHAIRSEFSVDLRDLRVLLLGAGGGAGRAIALQCAIENCERLVLVNRTLEKAQEIAKELAPYFSGSRVLGPVARLQAIPWDEGLLRAQIANTDLVVNATPVGMKRSDPALLSASLLAPHLMVYDTIYTPARTPLLAAAADAGALGANGLSMLLHQGARSFEIWFGRKAPLDAMRAALRL